MSTTSAAGAACAGEAQVISLVERARRGDRDAVEGLYRQHVDRIHGYLAHTVGNPHDAEDLTEQTFVRMIESIDRFRWGSAPFSAWLFRIARNLALDHFRATRRCHPDADPPQPAGALEPSAEDRFLAGFGRSGLVRSFRMLPPEQQQVLLLRIVWGLTSAETAATMEKSEAAVKALQHRALASLQRTVLPRAA
jgi:RNA polymerase sigma-70 factor (ECF subfamily)